MTAAEAEQVRHELADLLDVHPPRDWSDPLLRAVAALLDVYVESGAVNNPPAAVLQLVPRK